MYALRERRVHVTQEDFEMAVAKVGARGEVTLGGDGGTVSWAVFARTWELQGDKRGGCHRVRDTGGAAGTHSLAGHGG